MYEFTALFSMSSNMVTTIRQIQSTIGFQKKKLLIGKKKKNHFLWRTEPWKGN